MFDEFVVLDFETTGLDPATDRIIEVSALKYKDGILIDEFHTLINPKIKIPYEITEINGITNAMVKKKPTIDEVLPKLLDFIGGLPIVAHNAPFDAKFLKYNVLRYYGEDTINNTFVDTLAIARKLYPNLRNHKLETIKKHIKMDVDSHRAYDDTLVTAEIYLKYCNVLGQNRADRTDYERKTIKNEIELTSFSELDFPTRSKKKNQVIIKVNIIPNMLI
ncbi:3'-5' exonuclease [Caloramator sp. Dgby_cultured_2]|uniref:3'-5' exonuclease n=1 Tax=Caloramator sp. Dgby_cultured_2 TaxID=3029174 RepID=UPI00237D8A94|nr:exonuclease domain-containing protein [Caloramator sp. Dgby_cultured_2]WDU84503.1 exonuclease domain-containing protein [Caloramator sp. Dgby_cultured_2]